MLSEESGSKAKPVLMGFRHIYAWKVIVSFIVQSRLPLKGAKPRSEILNRAATRREALPNFCGKTATIILADKKLQAILDWLESFSVVENQKSDSF